MLHLARVLLLSALTLSAPVGYAADAAGDYPNRPMRFIAPFVAGGPSDILSRLLASRLSEAWGQQVVVDNRGSAGGVVGTELAARANPDGYTLLLATGSLLTINPNVYLKLPYDPIKDFAPITQITSGPYLMVLHPSVPAKTVPEFIAFLKTKAGQFNFAATGTNNLLSTELFKHLAGVQMTAINYKGTGQAVTAILSGEVGMFIMSPLVATPHMKAGKLRAIGSTGIKRNPALPDIPAIAETLPGFDQIVWHSVVVPAKVPAPIQRKLNAELVKILKSAEVQERFASIGLASVGSTQEELAKLIREETQVYAKLVKQIGFNPQ
jgi:tripartite-type tricarboxylate transporter receptor subunit TctC